MHTSTCEVSQKILKRFANKLLPVRSSLDISAYSQAEFAAVAGQLHELENELLNEDLNAETKEQIKANFKEVRDKIAIDPFNTVVDVYAWLNGTLLGSGMKTNLDSLARP